MFMYVGDVIGVPRHFESRSAVCPFYKCEEGRKIHCEGILNAETLNLVFNSQPKLSLHKSNYCNTLNYNKCPIAQLLQKKWANINREKSQ